MIVKSASAQRNQFTAGRDFHARNIANDAIASLARSGAPAQVEKRAPGANDTTGGRNGQTLLSVLTPRERQVLNLLVAGKMSKQIAGDLGLSTRTVELYRSRIMRKMNASNLAKLVCLLVCPDCASRFAIAPDGL
jgi:FixJ family two-component response regulator